LEGQDETRNRNTGTTVGERPGRKIRAGQEKKKKDPAQSKATGKKSWRRRKEADETENNARSFSPKLLQMKSTAINTTLEGRRADREAGKLARQGGRRVPLDGAQEKKTPQKYTHTSAPR